MAAGENGQTEFPYEENFFHTWRKRLKCLSHLIHIILCAKFSHISPAVCILVWKSQTQYHICVNFQYWLVHFFHSPPPPLDELFFFTRETSFTGPREKQRKCGELEELIYLYNSFEMHLLAGQIKFKHHNTSKIHHVVMSIRTEHIQVLYALFGKTVWNRWGEGNETESCFPYKLQLHRARH